MSKGNLRIRIVNFNTVKDKTTINQKKVTGLAKNLSFSLNFKRRHLEYLHKH